MFKVRKLKNSVIKYCSRRIFSPLKRSTCSFPGTVAIPNFFKKIDLCLVSSWRVTCMRFYTHVIFWSTRVAVLVKLDMTSSVSRPCYNLGLLVLHSIILFSSYAMLHISVWSPLLCFFINLLRYCHLTITVTILKFYIWSSDFMKISMAILTQNYKQRKLWIPPHGGHR